MISELKCYKFVNAQAGLALGRLSALNPTLIRGIGLTSKAGFWNMGKQNVFRIATNLGGLMLLSLVLVSTVWICGCQTSEGKFTDIFNPNPRVSNYATNNLLEGDVINITFQYSTNFNTLQKIGLAGSINLETVGEVKAAGKTPLQLQAELARLYKPQVKDDVITVKTVNAASSIYISGAVVRPGKVPFDRPMTVLEGIMEAGGFDLTRAKLSDVRVVRVENGQQKIYHLNVKDVLRGDEQTPFYLKPFDVVHVPLKTFNF